MLKTTQSIGRFLFSAFPIFLIFIFVSCGQSELYHGLSEKDATDMLVALDDAGIVADLEQVLKSQELSYTVLVDPKDVRAARKVIKQENLPRPKPVGLLEICGEKSLIQTPAERRCREILGKQGSLTKALENITGIVRASVVLNIPKESEFSDINAKPKPATASVLIQAKSGVRGLKMTEAKLQRFIANAVEGLDPRNVTVEVTYIDILYEDSKQVGQSSQSGSQDVNESTGKATDKPGLVKQELGLASIAGLTMTEPSKNRFKVYAISVLLVLILVSFTLILNILKMTRLKRQLGLANTKLSDEALSPDGQDMKMLDQAGQEAATDMPGTAGSTSSNNPAGSGDAQ